ncbi:hypothetical protein MRX96_046259 [Rhipicephalus microplus]
MTAVSISPLHAIPRRRSDGSPRALCIPACAFSVQSFGCSPFPKAASISDHDTPPHGFVKPYNHDPTISRAAVQKHENTASSTADDGAMSGPQTARRRPVWGNYGPRRLTKTRRGDPFAPHRRMLWIPFETARCRKRKLEDSGVLGRGPRGKKNSSSRARAHILGRLLHGSGIAATAADAAANLPWREALNAGTLPPPARTPLNSTVQRAGRAAYEYFLGSHGECLVVKCKGWNAGLR